MISVELLAKHMAWANQEIFKEVKKLGPEVLDYYVVDEEWTVKTIMVHIVAASYLYSQRLQEKPFSKIEFDYVLTVCDSANELCPVFPNAKNRIHKSFVDPKRDHYDSEEHALKIYAQTVQEISDWIETITF